MKSKAKIENIRQEMIAIYEKSITQLEATLSVSSLEGSPFLLLLEKDGLELVYGEWKEGKGFRAADLVPNHLCGTFQFSPDSARKNAELLNTTGQKASYVHWRTFLQNRLSAEKAQLAKFVATLGSKYQLLT